MFVFEETALIKKTKEFAEAILEKEIPSHLCYHDAQHTRDVVAACKEIGTACHLPEADMETLLLAAWLHDTGYNCNSYEHHEEESIKIAEKFLKDQGVDDNRIKVVKKVIAATKMPQNPTSQVEKVICDADLYHLGAEDYFEKSEQLRKEMKETKGMDLSDIEWLEMNINFFTQHDYFTQYGQEALKSKKDANLKKVKKKLEELKQRGKYVKKLEKEIRKLKGKESIEKAKPLRGIETMFRITSKNHLTLSAMADNKANIMISINAIILSILMTVLTRKFEDFPNLILPALILTFTSLLTIIFAILATRPNVSSGTFTPEDILNKKSNLLFFGNFHNTPLKDYEWAMKEMMKDGDYLYGSLIKDIYYLGIVLGRKYKLLRISYTVFMFGFVIAILSFLVAAFFNKPI